MSATTMLFGLGALWTVIGLLSALFMTRRGHSGFAWGILGAFLGPLVLPLALGAVSREHRTRPKVLRVGSALRGTVDVLVGIDDSRESVMALRTVVGLLGPRLRRLTLATVLEYEHQETLAGVEDERRAVAQLEGVAASITPEGAEITVLSGRPAAALGAFARDGRFHLLAVGSRGKGLSRALLGSTASALAREAPVPVLIAGPPIQQPKDSVQDENVAEYAEVRTSRTTSGVG